MRHRRRSSGSAEPQDEPTALAGWLYTDLLLGLAVVFLASVAFLVPKTESDTSGKPPRITTPRSTTTTLKKPKLCDSLYSPAREAESGIWLVIPASLTNAELLATFPGLLQGEFDVENTKLLAEGSGILYFDQVRLGYVRGQAGGQGNEQVAANLLDRLAGLFPQQFEGAALRAGWSGKQKVGQVGLEILPYVARPCKDR